ncbi:hypothetical protein Pmani_033736 [Petrolisthes manimaculis]|uniref:Uncharacterized protein n=1 Tax=Petrolisthes manimaculis TaxID=1843537 RepID=A0AAE1NRB5_9EUCA|nr:hypothetical protein Pmani_033736 [Petrolisthes manimaculis]
MNNIIRAKCLILGDSTVGKSSLTQAFVSDTHQYQKNYNMTQGVEILTKMINVPDTQSSVELYLYDCSGKEFYRGLVTKMSSQASLIVLVYDVTSENSFNLVTTFHDLVKTQGNNDGLRGVVFANKTDLTNRRKISPKAGRDLANSLGLMYFEGSVKDQKGIDAPFFYLVNEWFKLYMDKTQSFKLLS